MHVGVQKTKGQKLFMNISFKLKAALIKNELAKK